MRQPTAAQILRELMQQPDIITLPCCFDAFSAKLIERAGFKATFIAKGKKSHLTAWPPPPQPPSPNTKGGGSPQRGAISCPSAYSSPPSLSIGGGGLGGWGPRGATFSVWPFISGFASIAAHYGLPDMGLISFGEAVEIARPILNSLSIPVFVDADTGYGSAINIQRTVRSYARAGAAAVMIEDQVWPKRCGHVQGKQVVGRQEAINRIRAASDARDRAHDILILARTDARGF